MLRFASAMLSYSKRFCAPQPLTRSLAVNVPRVSVRTRSTSEGLSVTPYDPNVVNKVMLTGFTGKDVDTVENQYGTVGRVSLAVSQGSRDNKKTQWFNLWLEDPELYRLCKQNMPKGSHIHVQGRLMFEDKGNPSVLAELVYMVDTSLESSGGEAAGAAPSKPASSYPKATGGRPIGDGSVPDVSHLKDPEQLWKLVFERPDLWWDNRTKKRNPKAPDFKWREGRDGPALWIDSKNTPFWVKEHYENSA